MLFLKITLDLLVGAAIGALIGRTQSCKTGACPLTANPRRGAIWGGFLGLWFALSMPLACSVSSNDSKTAAAPTNPPAASAALAASESAKDPIVQISGMDQFNKEVMNRPGKTVIDFYATWCGPCKIYSPILEKLAQAGLPGVSFVKVDVDQSPDIAKQFNIEAMPTTVILEGGKEVQRFLGVQSEDTIRQALGA